MKIYVNSYPLEYDFNSYYYGNCYSYAIVSKFVDNSYDDYIYNLGNISHVYYPPKNLLEAHKAFVLNMDVLSTNCRKSSFSENLLPNELKVVLFYDERFSDFYDFHLIRQDFLKNLYL